ncbi:MAG: cryptochrome/photolyase family protein [Bacteroidales bacterium]|nr:cryptochrome/photolyase family protein [Bacteroidales bacterium]
MKTLRLILGDQLNSHHSWFKTNNSDIIYVMMEIKPETEYVLHHGQKILAIFSAMRTFAEELKQSGHHVHYLHFDDDENAHSFEKNIKNLIKKYKTEYFEYQEPDAIHGWSQKLSELTGQLNVSTKVHPLNIFLPNANIFKNTFFEGKKSWLMETFYRDMRRKHQILMEGNQPLKGKWNFDKSNRNKLPANHKPPEPKSFGKPDPDVMQLLQDKEINYFGEIDEASFTWPVSRKQSLVLLDYFVDYLLPYFGTYQDAMSERSWSLYHSRLSFSLNVKMLSPQEVIQKVLNKYYESDDVDIAQTEGFIRQILGWREFMRGVYWAYMPQYAEMNHFNHQRSLPKFYWDGNTKMNCLKHSINQSLKFAYAHHIQRLMITGNFALLNETHPDETDWWYLGIYIDAFEWVEMPNTGGYEPLCRWRCLRQPTNYVRRTANYMRKMSDYCRNRFYDKSRTTGETACPFNPMLWTFTDKKPVTAEWNRLSWVFCVSSMGINASRRRQLKIFEQSCMLYKKHVR